MLRCLQASVDDLVGEMTCVDEDLNDEYNFQIQNNPPVPFYVDDNLLRVSLFIGLFTEFVEYVQ